MFFQRPIEQDVRPNPIENRTNPCNADNVGHEFCHLKTKRPG